MLASMDEERVTAILKSADVPATIEWYVALGFEERGRVPEEDPTWCELARDGVVLQFLGGDTPWPDPPAFTGCLYVHPASVDDVSQQIGGRIEPEWGPEDRAWGTRELGFRDPNGYFLTFTQPSG